MSKKEMLAAKEAEAAKKEATAGKKKEEPKVKVVPAESNPSLTEEDMALLEGMFAPKFAEIKKEFGNIKEQLKKVEAEATKALERAEAAEKKASELSDKLGKIPASTVIPAPASEYAKANKAETEEYSLKLGYIIEISSDCYKMEDDEAKAAVICETLGVDLGKKKYAWVDKKGFVKEKVTAEQLQKLGKI